MRKVRLYYDVVCPYSYMEGFAPSRRSRTPDGSRSSGCPSSCGLPRGRCSRCAATTCDGLDAERLPQGAARHRDPPAAVSATLDAAAGRVPLGRRAGSPAGLSSTRSTRRSSAKGGHRDRSRARPRRGAGRARPGRRGSGGLLRTSASSRSARSGARRGGRRARRPDARHRRRREPLGHGRPPSAISREPLVPRTYGIDSAADSGTNHHIEAVGPASPRRPAVPPPP